MRVRCFCGRIASTKRACKVCGSTDPMRHEHDGVRHAHPHDGEGHDHDVVDS